MRRSFFLTTTSNNGATHRNLSPLPNDEWQAEFTPGQAGSYPIAISAKDSAGNRITNTHTLLVEDTAPGLSLTLSESSNFGYINANTVYYGNNNSDFIITALMTDTGSKLDTVTFPDTTSVGGSYTLNGLATATQVHNTTFTATDTFSNTVQITTTDRAGNATIATFDLISDKVGPTVAFNVPATSGLGVSISWEGLDIGAGVRSYSVQVKEAGGSWLPWLVDVSYTKATFIGDSGKRYLFQIQATDNVNNESLWLESNAVSVEAVTKYYAFGGQKVAMRQGSEVYYLGGDHLGSTSLTTDSSGAVVSEVRYLPYGQVRWSNGSSVTDFGFTSQREEAGFGLVDYNARYYSAVLGRFVSPDTIVPDPMSSGGMNRYRYVKNNPLKYVDPSGHFTEEEIKASLKEQYGENEANKVWAHWQLDESFMRMLENAQSHSDVWASNFELNGSHKGEFRKVKGSNRIVIDWENSDGTKETLDLYQLQGKGGYQLRHQDDSVSNPGTGGLWQAVYEYDDQGRIVSDGVVADYRIHWDKNLFGMTDPVHALLVEEISSNIAPWEEKPSWTGSTSKGMFGKFHRAAGWAILAMDQVVSPLYPTTATRSKVSDGTTRSIPIYFINPNDL